MEASRRPSRADVLMRAALRLCAPLVRLLVKNGVRYPDFSRALKDLFVDAARAELASTDRRQTDSAVSLLSGVHRKDLRERALAPADADEVPASMSLSAQLFTRWVSDPVYKLRNGRPRALPRNGPAPSFESLATSVSRDVHPRSMLDELVRLGVATVDDEVVKLAIESFVPSEGFAEMAGLFADNVADHLAAGAHNLAGVGPRFLEQGVFAVGLGEASVTRLGTLAREEWAQTFQRFVAAATECCKADEAKGGTNRIRFGVYFYSEAAEPASPRSAQNP